MNKNKLKGCFLHKSDYWKTPKEIYDHYMNEGYFDPCPENPTFDGLKIDWKEKNFVNPPYSKIKFWISKAIIEALKGHESVFLVPARTDTRWFHVALDQGAEITFIRGRLHFNDGKTGAPFPSIYLTFKQIN